LNSARPMPTPLADLVAKATGLNSNAIRLSLRPPLDHQSNRLYEAWAGDQHLILKEYLKPDELLEAPVREIRALERVASLDIAPRPVLYEPATASLGPIVIYEYLEGEMWDRRRPSREQLAQLAEVWIRLHTSPTDGLWPSHGFQRSLDESWVAMRARLQTYADWATANFAPGQKLAAVSLSVLERCRSLVKELTALPVVLCFCRGDARFANVIQRPTGDLGMVDWEDSGLRDPARELADLLTGGNQEDLLSPQAWETGFLQPYFAVRTASDPSLRQRMELYLGLFPIFWLALLLSHGLTLANDVTKAGQLSNWTINGLPANERLRRYLARALAWPEMNFSHELESLQEMEFFPTCVS